MFLFVPLALKSQYIDRKELRKKPKTIEEATLQLNKVYTDSAINEIKQFNEEYFVFISNNSIGGYIVPYWFQNFVSHTKLTKDFNSHGIENFQDVAVLIYRSFYREINNLPVEFEEQIKIIHDYYNNKNDSVWLENTILR